MEFKVYLYSKKAKLIGIYLSPSKKEFEKNKLKYCSEYVDEENYISYEYIENPCIDGNTIREMTKEELYKQGKYQLQSNELIENGKIKTIELSEFEYIEDNSIKFKRDEKIQTLLNKLNTLKKEYIEKAFIFEKGGKNYYQKNRDLDKNNLTSIVVMLNTTGQKVFKDWKFKDENNNDVYTDLTIEDMFYLSGKMQNQMTKAMKTESELISNIKNLSDDELKEIDIKKEFEELWKK